MAVKSGDARRSGATPGWAWAVAGLCGLLLIPVALEDHHLVRIVTPVHLAGPATPAANLALAGHGAVTRHGTGSARVNAGAAAGRRSVQVTGEGVDSSDGSGGSAPSAAPGAPLTLQNPGGVLATTGSSGVPAAGSVVLAGGPAVVTVAAQVPAAAAREDGSPWTGALPRSSGVTTRRVTPSGSALITPHPVKPQPRFWAKHFRPGPASRIRRRHHPRIYGFFVTPGN
jgi:hypothetical protein